MVDSLTLNKLKAIPEKEWGCIYKKLVLYADLKLKMFGFDIRTEKDSIDAETFATEAIEKLFDGSRTWDSLRFPDILIHLKGIVKSLLSNHFKTSAKSIVSISTDVGSQKDDNIDEFTSLEIHDGLRVFTESPEELIIADEKWAEIEASFGNNKDEFVVFSDWLDGNVPRDIASAYDLDIKLVYNAIRNGKRNVKSLYKKR